ncbi:MAG TPA: cytochrome c oxidase assembly factor Coa1 family protein [Pyrinomonadaceae bacterium]|jgi:hypothetical protein
MTTKKLFIIIGGIVAAIVLLIVIFVGAVIGFTFYTIGKSEAATTARTFLKNNEKLKQDIGEVKDFGSIITGSINTRNSDGVATLSLKVIGERRTVNANVDLMYRNNRAWRVTDAYYQNDKGQTIKLLDPYETGAPEP